MRSWPLGAVRMTERFLPGDRSSASSSRRCARTSRRARRGAAGCPSAGRDGGRLAGIGGTVRNLGAAAELAADLPSFGVQGLPLEREALDDLVERFADMTASERGEVPGIKPERGDLILAGAVVDPVGDGDRRLRRARGHRGRPARGRLLLDAAGGPRPAAVRGRAPRQRAQPRRATYTPTWPTPSTSRGSRSGSGTRSARPAAPGDPRERELLWAAAMLHDIGTAVDYDDHHKHSRYLVLNAGLPGYTTRETALIGQIVRYHRKGNPSLGRARGSRPQRRRGRCWCAARRCCGSASSSSAARPGRPRRAPGRRRRPRRAAARRRRGRDGRRWASARATCSSARSGAS